MKNVLKLTLLLNALRKLPFQSLFLESKNFTNCPNATTCIVNFAYFTKY
jgi:hypothetical protein